MTSRRAHPFMPNSVPAARQALLDELGVASTDTLFEQIPASHRLQRPIDLPPPLSSETELRRHMTRILARNRSCEAYLNFLGGGCWQHHVPAICDEIVRRSEFLTPVWGTPSSDLGRNQAWFEFTSQLGELVDMDLVALPVYSWGCAAGHAIRMAERITGRKRVLIPRYLDPERSAVIRNYCEPPEMRSHVEIVEIAVDAGSRQVDMDDLARKLSGDVAAVYFENPAYLGHFEAQAADIVAAAHEAGALAIVGVDPVSLGIARPPGAYGADIAVGSIQPLGIHMHCGGGLGGFMASRDEPLYAHEYPALMVSVAETTAGELGFGLALMHQSSYGSREDGKDWTGNSTYLWAIGCAAYMALLGPEGFRELGELVIQRAHYAAALIDELPGIEVSSSSGFFKEFVVNFDSTGKTVAQVNRALLQHEIHGGLDLSASFDDLGQSSLYCVTELHAREDIDRLVAALAEVTR